MKLQTTVEVTTEIDISPALKRKLMTKLKSYADLKEQRDAIDDAMDADNAEVEEIRAHLGLKTFPIEGFGVTRVEGTTSKLDHERLVQLGCAMAWIKEATRIAPKKAYTLITCPNGKTAQSS